MRAEIHNAKMCTRDGSDYWIGALFGAGRSIIDTGAFDTAEEAESWCKREAMRRGYEAIEVRDTTTVQP